MKLIFKKPEKNILKLIRELGYVLKFHKNEEFNCVRTMTGTKYPRFHLFIKEVGTNLIFNLHIDQKRISYQGSHAHNGEYESEVVKKELKRIKEIIDK